MSDRVKELLARQSLIHKDVWDAQKNGFRKKEEPLQKALDSDSDISEKMINEFESLMEKAEEKNTTYLGYIKELEDKKSTFDGIANHDLCPKPGKEKGWDKSFVAIEARLKEFQFDEFGKYKSGKLTKLVLDKINLTALTKMWKEKLSKTRNAIIFGIPKWLQEHSTLIISDDDAKEKAERIYDLIEEIKKDEDHDLSEVHRLSDELVLQFKKADGAEESSSPQKKKNKNKGGKCPECNTRTSHLFGKTQTCGDCFEDGEFYKHWEKLQRREELWSHNKENRAKYRKYMETYNSDFQDAIARFSDKHTLENYNELMNLLEKCKSKVPVDGETVSKKPLLDSSSDDEEEEEDDDEEEEEEEEDYKPKKDKKRAREDEDEDEDDVIEQILETLIVATPEDKQKLFDNYKENKDSLKENLDAIRKKRMHEYTFTIYFMLNEKKQPIPHGQDKQIFYRKEDAAECAQKWIDSLGEQGSIYKYEVIKVED